jgi:hypothetical protein
MIAIALKAETEVEVRKMIHARGRTISGFVTDILLRELGTWRAELAAQHEAEQAAIAEAIAEAVAAAKAEL